MELGREDASGVVNHACIQLINDLLLTKSKSKAYIFVTAIVQIDKIRFEISGKSASVNSISMIVTGDMTLP